MQYMLMLVVKAEETTRTKRGGTTDGLLVKTLVLDAQDISQR